MINIKVGRWYEREKKQKRIIRFGLVEGRTPDFSHPRTFIWIFVRSEHSTTELQAHDSDSPSVGKWQIKLCRAMSVKCKNLLKILWL